MQSLQAQLAAVQAPAAAAYPDLRGEVERLKAQVESLELDRALKEAEAEELTAEAEELRAQLQAAEAELREAREADSKRTSELMASLAATTEQKEAVRLLEQNAQLTAALSRLRDLTVSEKAKAAAAVSELTEEVRLLREVEEEHAALKKRCERLQREVGEYREQLDELSEYQQMVEQLTDKNMRLSDERRALSERVVFLQNLNEASEEVEESHLELEATLSSELEAKDAEVADLQAKLRYRALQVEEANKTLRQFRELVRSMEAEMKALRDREVSRSVGERIGGQDVGHWGSQSVLLLSQLRELRAKHVKEQLALVEADESRQRFDFVAHYLPDNVRVDERSLDAMAALLRIRGKLSLLQSTVLDYYTSRQVYAKNEELAIYAYHLLLLLTETQRLADFLHSRLPSLSADAWEAVVSGYRELQQVEGDVDSYVGLVEQDAVNEVTGVSSLVHTYDSLRDFMTQRMGIDDASVDSVTQPRADQPPAIPFSVGSVYVLRRVARLTDAKAQQAREEAQDQQLLRLTQAIEAKAVRAPASTPLTLSTDGRFLLYSCQLLGVLMTQVGDAVQVVSTARKESRLRAKRLKEVEGGVKVEEVKQADEAPQQREAQRRNDLLDGDVAGAGDEEEEGAEYHRLYLQLEDVHGNLQQIAQQIVQTATTLALAGKVVAAARRDEVLRLVLLAGLRVQRCVSEMTNLTARVRAIAKDERVEKVRRMDADEEARLVSELKAQLAQHVQPAGAGVGGLNLSHEVNQLKATMLELTRTMAAGEDAPPPPASTAHPSLAHAATVRVQLEASAALRIQLQELHAKMSERQREVVALKTREQEQQSKVAVMQAKLALLQGKVEGVEGQRVELEQAKAELAAMQAQVTAAAEDVDRLAKENKLLRKQVLKLKHQTAASKGKAVEGGQAVVAASGGGGGDAAVLELTVRALRAELLAVRGQRAWEALQADVPAFGVERRPVVEEAEGELLRGMRGRLSSLQRRLFDHRTQPRVVDITGGTRVGEEGQGKAGEAKGEEEKTQSPPLAPLTVRGGGQLSASELERARRVAVLGQLQAGKQRVRAELSAYVDRKRTQRFIAPFVSTPTPPLISSH